jgi:drug/metabolite transporter (DMT)-like permease
MWPMLAMLGLGAGGTAIATILTATAAGRMGATKAAVSAFIIPVVALLLGVVVRHESVNSISIAGAAVCLLGAAILRNPSMLAGRLPRRFIGVGARV